MPVTYQAVLDGARASLNDAKTINGNPVANLRYQDQELLNYLNEGFLHLFQYRSDLFQKIGPVPCGAVGTTEVTLPAGALAVTDVLSVVGGGGVDRTSFDAVRAYRPTWRTDPPGPCVNWFQTPDDEGRSDPRSFSVTPPVPANQVLTVQYSAAPTVVLLANTTTSFLPTPDDYQVMMEAYLIFRAEMKDDQYVNTQRAIQFFQLFEKAAGAAQVEEKVIA